jgi:hypothetical protein
MAATSASKFQSPEYTEIPEYSRRDLKMSHRASAIEHTFAHNYLNIFNFFSTAGHRFSPSENAGPHLLQRVDEAIGRALHEGTVTNEITGDRFRLAPSSVRKKR